MFDLQIWLFWRGPQSGKDLVGQLMSEVPGLIAVKPNDWPAADYHGLAFEDMFWARARYYLDKIRPWLRQRGANDFLVQINGVSVEEYLERQISADIDRQTRVRDAVKGLKGSRFSIPNPRIKRARQLLEKAIS